MNTLQLFHLTRFCFGHVHVACACDHLRPNIGVRRFNVMRQRNYPKMIPHPEIYFACNRQTRICCKKPIDRFNLPAPHRLPTGSSIRRLYVQMRQQLLTGDMNKRHTAPSFTLISLQPTFENCCFFLSGTRFKHLLEDSHPLNG